MAAVIRYTVQEKKTMWQGLRLVSGVNCRPESVYDDFLRTKLLYHKNDGTLFFHMVQSFPKDEKVNPTVAHAAALKLAEYFEGREVLVSTHVDRGHIHSHFIINSVSLETGKKLHISEPELTELRQRNDQVCVEFGLPVFQPQKKKVKAMSGAEYHSAAKGESWKFRLMNVIDECMKFAHTREEFIALMRTEGYEVRWSDSRKNITYTTPGGKRCRDDRLHDEKYLKVRMELEFRIREAIIAGRVEAEKFYATGSRAASYGSGMVGTEYIGNCHGENLGGADSDSGGTGRTIKSKSNVGADSQSTNSADKCCNGTDSDSPHAGTGWEEERTALFAKAPTARAPQALDSVANSAGNPVRIAGSLVQLGRALERSDGVVPMKDATTIHGHADSKTLRREREKKIALGHKADDHEDEQNQQQTM